MDFFRSYQNNSFNQNYQTPFQNTQPQIQFFVVNNLQEAQNIQVQFNIIYFIMNNNDKEIYVKQLNRDGLIEFNVYKNEKVLKKDLTYFEILEELKQKIDKIEKSICANNIDNQGENNNE